MAAGPDEALLPALRHYRTTRPSVRILLLAPGRQPGDRLIANLVGLGVYDIVAPADAFDLPATLAVALQNPPASYAEAARWHHAAQGRPGEPSKQSQESREYWRVVTGGYRPFVIGVAGAGRAVGTSDLAWHLAVELSRRGISAALLADGPAVVVTRAIQHLLPGTLPITVYANDSPDPPLKQKHPRHSTVGAARRGEPQDRLRMALEDDHGAQVVVVDFGSLLRAREHEQSLLAAVDASSSVGHSHRSAWWQPCN